MTDQELAAKDKKEVTREELTRPGRAYQPEVDIYETTDALWLWADMPGVDEKSINIDLADGMLTIDGRVALDEYKDLTPVYTEYNVGNYVRRFSISNDIDVDRIDAKVRNGVVELKLPKIERAKTRKIAVSAG